MHSAILQLFINFFKSAQPVILSRSNARKPLVTSPDWPSPESWRSLNDSVSGNLLAPFPPSIVCDSSRPQSFDLRKGGGSTFGVLIHATLQTYPIPMVTPAFLAFNSTAIGASQNGNTNFFSAVAYLQTQLPSLSTSGLMGYFSMTPLTESNNSPPINFDFLIYALSPSPSALENRVRPVMDQVSSITGITPLLDVKQTVDFTTFRTTYLTAATVGSKYLGGNRLWDTKAVGDRKATAKALKAFEKG